jgi:hypothetical protein
MGFSTFSSVDLHRKLNSELNLCSTLSSMILSLHEANSGWRRLHDEELHNVYVSPNIISVIKSRRMI